VESAERPSDFFILILVRLRSSISETDQKPLAPIMLDHRVRLVRWLLLWAASSCWAPVVQSSRSAGGSRAAAPTATAHENVTHENSSRAAGISN